MRTFESFGLTWALLKRAAQLVLLMNCFLSSSVCLAAEENSRGVSSAHVESNDNSRIVQSDEVTLDGNSTNAEIAAKLLQDAAQFFRVIAEENPSLRESMNVNADTYDEAAKLLRENPEGKAGSSALQTRD